MQLGTIALKLRAATTRFENRVAGAAELELALQSTLTKDMAFIIPLSEDCPPNEYDSGINQLLRERFGVVVALATDSDDVDKTGLTAYDLLHTTRAQIFTALLGWQIGGTEESIVYYVGGRLLGINRAYLWYQFEFEYTTRLGEDDGVTAEATDWFNDIFAQYIIAPNINLPITPVTEPYSFAATDPDIPVLPVTTFAPDLTAIIDFENNPDDGGFSNGFGKMFQVYQG